MARAVKCSCGHKSCDAWHVSPHADLQGNRFTKEEAEAVANLLNQMTAVEEVPRLRKIIEGLKKRLASAENQLHDRRQNDSPGY